MTCLSKLSLVFFFLLLFLRKTKHYTHQVQHSLPGHSLSNIVEFRTNPATNSQLFLFFSFFSQQTYKVSSLVFVGSEDPIKLLGGLNFVWYELEFPLSLSSLLSPVHIIWSCQQKGKNSSKRSHLLQVKRWQETCDHVILYLTRTKNEYSLNTYEIPCSCFWPAAL